MNLKSIFLTICLTASPLIAPQKTFGIEQQSHKKVHYLCVREAKDSLKCVETKEHKYLDVQKAKEIESSSSLTAAMPALNTNRETVALHNKYGRTHTHEVLVITVILVSTLSLWLLLYTKQRNKRLAFRHQNIEALERLWKISNYQ